jgi:hypothetical protein
MDLAKVVSTIKQYTFNEGSYSLEKGEFNLLDAKFKVVVYDYGVKKNILRMLVDRGWRHDDPQSFFQWLHHLRATTIDDLNKCQTWAYFFLTRFEYF